MLTRTYVLCYYHDAPHSSNSFALGYSHFKSTLSSAQTAGFLHHAAACLSAFCPILKEQHAAITVPGVFVSILLKVLQHVATVALSS